MCLRICRLEVRPFKLGVIVVDAKPRECIDDALGPLRFVTRLIGVFNAQDEGTAFTQRECPVVQSGAGTTHMEKAGR